MAVETKKSEVAAKIDPVEAKPSVLEQEIAGLQAELASLRRNYNVLDTAHKRAQKKIAQFESEKSLPKEAPAQSNPTTVNSTVTNAASTIATAETSIGESHDHEMKWVPPYCGEHGCENKLFLNQVKCAGCGGPIGSEAYAKHELKACPLCGQNAGYKPVPGYQTKHDNCTGPDCKVVKT
jgi:hypothetical protein